VCWNVGGLSVPSTKCMCPVKVKYIVQHWWHGSSFRAI
jgi:hypothetical protein